MDPKLLDGVSLVDELLGHVDCRCVDACVRAPIGRVGPVARLLVEHGLLDTLLLFLQFLDDIVADELLLLVEDGQTVLQ